MEEEKKPVSISSELHDQIARRVENSNGEFTSVDSYVEYVLRELFDENENISENEISKEEKKKIEDELKKMGYI